MQHTTSHELSQWAETDRILREDFNSDNAKIEAALAGMLGRSQIIKSISLTVDTKVDLDLSDIDWNQWSAVGFILDIYIGGNYQAPGNIYCQTKTVQSVKQYCSQEDNGYIAVGTYMPVLREFLSCFPLIFRAFPAFCLSVIRCADHKKRPFFIQRQADETHHLLPQTTPLVYCTSLLHKCP